MYSAVGEKEHTMIQMEVTAANGASGDLEDYIALFDNLGFVGLD